MIQAERVRHRLLEEIDDIAVLMRPFGEPLPLSFSRKRRLPTARLRQWMRSGGRAGLCARLCAEDQRGFGGSGVHEADGDAPVRLRQDLRWHVATYHFESFRKNHAVAFDAQAAIKNDGVAITVVALWIFVRLDDENTALTFGRTRLRKLHLAVAAVGLCGAHQR